MQSAESSHARAHGGLLGRLVRWLLDAAQQSTRLIAFLLWIGVASFVWFRSILPLPYAVVALGGSVSLVLLAVLLGVEAVDPGRWGIPAGRSWTARLLLAACLLGVAAGTIGVARSLAELTASQPQPTTTAVAAGAVLVGSLLVLTDRVCGHLVAGLAALAVGGAVVAAPDASLLTAMVFSPDGIYGPLTRGAATWIAPVCLLGGLWRAAGVGTGLIPASESSGSASRWLSVSGGWGKSVGRLTAATVFVAVLIAWQTVETGEVLAVGFAALPVAVIWAALVWTGRLSGGGDGGETNTPLGSSTGSLLLIGGPLVAMAVLAVGYRHPAGTVLIGGCLLAIGLCLLWPLVGRGRAAAGDQGGVRDGIAMVLDGSIFAMALLARVLVVLAVVGGVVAVLRTVGLSTELLSAAVWLSGGYAVVATVLLVACCIVLGTLVPPLAGYATAALVVVPLVRTLTPLPGLTTHLVVWYAVVAGGLLAVVGRGWAGGWGWPPGWV